MGLFKKKEPDLEKEVPGFVISQELLDFEDHAVGFALENLDSLVEIPFEIFQKKHPDYQKKLQAYMEDLSKLYHMVSNEQYRKIKKDARLSVIAYDLGFGMLMRHALEAISVDIYMLGGGIPDKEMVHDRLEFLRGWIIPASRDGVKINLYDVRKDIILRKALNLTNMTAHPHVIGESTSYIELHRFYEDVFSGVVQEHIEGSGNRAIRRYLRKLKSCLDDFNIMDRLPRTLLLGCLVRQLTECSTNWWCWEQKMVPTDMSTRENPITISRRLTELSMMIPEKKLFGRSKNALTQDAISTLFTLKNASNHLMHMPKGYVQLGDVLRYGRELAKLNPLVQAECSPGAMMMKFDMKLRRKRTCVTMLLCGLFGWAGAHEFYVGNILYGIFYPLMYVVLTGFTFNPARLALGTSYALFDFIFLLLPFGELCQMDQKKFISEKWGKITTDGFVEHLLFYAMVAVQIGVIYLVFFRQG